MTVPCWVCAAIAATDQDDTAAVRITRASRNVVAPRRHVASLSLLDDNEYQAVWSLALAGQTRVLSGTMARSAARDAIATDHAHLCIISLPSDR